MASYLDIAIAELGITDNANESGFILPDGRFLKMGEYGNRGLDHRVVAGIVRGEFEYRSDAMYQWMSVTGSIRWTPENGTIELVTSPTSDQLATIEELLSALGTMTVERTHFARGQWRSLDSDTLDLDTLRDHFRRNGRKHR